MRRLIGLQQKGLIGDVVPHRVVAGSSPEWEAMTDAEMKMSSRAMEVYAGMVDRMDQETGRLLDWLDRKGEMDNTVSRAYTPDQKAGGLTCFQLIMFLSDNGAEGGAYEASPVMGPRLLSVLDKYYDNSYENLGRYDSFIWYGSR